MTKQQFIDEIAKYVKKYAPQFGIKVYSPVIAQACLESAYGTSTKAAYHNYFGLKYKANRVQCNKGYFMDGGSEQNANGTYTNLPSSTAWYAFENLEQGVLGYFQFINSGNYSNLKGVTDPYKYLENIKADGYATSLNYVKNVYSVITNWNLTKYDEQGGTTMAAPVYTVAIDAGHGSNTAGKRTVDGYREHWINVKTAYYCEQMLNQHGVKTVRIAWNDTNATDDADISLSERQKMIKNANCILSVSMHANAYGNGAAWTTPAGVSTHIHATQSYRGDSEALARLVQEELIKGTKQNNRGVVLQNLAMCNCNAMGVKAACLVEIAFMTNTAEAELMKTEAFCKEQGEDIARGVLRYLGIAVKATNTPLINNTTTTTPSTTTTNTTTSSKFKVGDTVRLQQGAKYITGQQPAAFMFTQVLYVRAIKGSVITVSTLKTGAVSGNVYEKDLVKDGEQLVVIPSTTVVTPSTSDSFLVQVTANALNIRKGPGTLYGKTGCITDKGRYTIVEEKNGWGKLKSGVGWISLKYTKRL